MRTPRGSWRHRLWVPAAVGVVAWAGLAAPAWAHTDLEGTVPRAGARVSADTTAVTLRFNEPVGPGATVVVADRAGDNRARGRAIVRGATVREPLQALERPGPYRVSYRVVPADGHPITGRFRFRVDPVAAPGPRTTSPTPAAVVVGGGAGDSPAASPATGGAPNSRGVAASRGTPEPGSTTLLPVVAVAGTFLLVVAGGPLARRRAARFIAGRGPVSDG